MPKSTASRPSSKPDKPYDGFPLTYSNSGGGRWGKNTAAVSTTSDLHSMATAT